MVWLIAIAVILFILCAVLLVVEFFIPSFGLIFIVALCCLAGGISIFYKTLPNSGWTGIVTAIVVIPIVFVIVFKIFPHTGLGKSVSLEGPTKKTGEGVPDADQLQRLLGKTGVTISPLRPVGMSDFDGMRFECVAETGYVEKGRQVKVIKVESTQLTVRQIENS